MYRFACPLCDEEIETKSDIKRSAKKHLEIHSREEIDDHFRENYQGSDCLGGCGFSFSFGAEEHPGLVCPKCERDHFSWYLGRLGFWNAESVDKE